jgi:ERCC4-type nuclease
MRSNIVSLQNGDVSYIFNMDLPTENESAIESLKGIQKYCTSRITQSQKILESCEGLGTEKANLIYMQLKTAINIMEHILKITDSGLPNG